MTNQIMPSMDGIVAEMKKRIPDDPRTKPYFDRIVADGFTEEQAKEIMIFAWLEWNEW